VQITACGWRAVVNALRRRRVPLRQAGRHLRAAAGLRAKLLDTQTDSRT